MKLLDCSEVSIVSGANECICYWAQENFCYSCLSCISCWATLGISTICCPVPGIGERGIAAGYKEASSRAYNVPNAGACIVKCCTNLNGREKERYKYSGEMFDC